MTRHAIELAAQNTLWMGGNTFLAWSAVLIALHLRGSDGTRRAAGRILVAAAALLLLGRLAVHGELETSSLPSTVTFVVFALVASLWSWRARAGDRWARWVGIAGIVAFAPNAPYILTDCFHHMQDVRRAPGIVAAALFAVEYGWFLTLAGASWIALLVLGRDTLHERRPGTPPLRVFVPVAAVIAFGIYLGRIERFHSWHPLLEPVRFAREVARAFTNPGPIAFTLVWWTVIVVVGIAGVRLHDRARAAGWRPVALVVASAWALTAVLLAATPFVPAAYRNVGAPVPDASALRAVVCIALGVLLAAAVAVQFARGFGRKAPGAAVRWAVVACVAVTVVGAGFTAASSAQWWAQFRGLCEYGPNPELHGDAC